MLRLVEGNFVFAAIIGAVWFAKMLAAVAAPRGWQIKCWTPANVGLLLYLGLSHLAFAAGGDHRR